MNPWLQAWRRNRKKSIKSFQMLQYALANIGTSLMLRKKTNKKNHWDVSSL
jgi:hypothetical protein